MSRDQGPTPRRRQVGGQSGEARTRVIRTTPTSSDPPRGRVRVVRYEPAAEREVLCRVRQAGGSGREEVLRAGDLARSAEAIAAHLRGACGLAAGDLL